MKTSGNADNMPCKPQSLDFETRRKRKVMFGEEMLQTFSLRFCLALNSAHKCGYFTHMHLWHPKCKVTVSPCFQEEVSDLALCLRKVFALYALVYLYGYLWIPLVMKINFP